MTPKEIKDRMIQIGVEQIDLINKYKNINYTQE